MIGCYAEALSVCWLASALLFEDKQNADSVSVDQLLELATSVIVESYGSKVLARQSVKAVWQSRV